MFAYIFVYPLHLFSTPEKSEYFLLYFCSLYFNLYMLNVSQDYYNLYLIATSCSSAFHGFWNSYVDTD